jgi:hypothetical protein
MMHAPTRLKCIWFGFALLCVLPAWAGGAASSPSADVRFDRTGDGLVDAEDWKRLKADEKVAYARDSLLELGLAPEAAVGNGRTRLQDYLDGLRSVYGR